MKYVRKGDNLKDTVDFLINETETNGFKIKGLYLDKEFYTVNVINYLQNRKTPFIIPYLKRRSSGGIRNLFKGKKNLLYRIYYAFKGK
jgi:putative transposase